VTVSDSVQHAEIKAVQPAMSKLLESNKQTADDGAGLPSDGLMWSDVVSRRHGIQRPKSFQLAVVATVYVDP
jgi:hypothetical protein